MYKKISNFIGSLLALILAGLPGLVLAEAAAPTSEKVDFGLEETAAAGKLITDANRPPAIGPATVAGTIVGYLLAFVGVIFFILMIYGGMLWMTARGSEEQIKKAQDLIKSAIIGLVIIGLSYVVTRFVLTQLIAVV